MVAEPVKVDQVNLPAPVGHATNGIPRDEEMGQIKILMKPAATVQQLRETSQFRNETALPRGKRFAIQLCGRKGNGLVQPNHVR